VPEVNLSFSTSDMSRVPRFVSARIRLK